MFSGSENSIALLGIRLHLETRGQKLEMAADKSDVPIYQLRYTPHISLMPTLAMAMLAIGSRPVSAIAASDVS
jgi:hypothetical protein